MSETAVKKPLIRDLYESDFHLWTVAQAKALRTGEVALLDVAHLAEELEALGRSEKHEIASRLKIILVHLLKWQTQPERRSRSWQVTLLVQRQEIAERMEASPSLRAYPAEILRKQYRAALCLAAAETGLPEAEFAKDCPFTIAEVLDPDCLAQ